MKEIFKCVFGSRMYGLDTEKSDLDYKSVFIPTREEIILQRVPQHIKRSTSTDKQRNTSADVDEEFFPLNDFMKRVCDNDIDVMDMLHCPESCIVITSEPWEWIQKHRSLFYTTKLGDRYVEYAMRQAKRYGITASPTFVLEQVIAVLEASDKEFVFEETALLQIPTVVTDNKFIHINGKRFPVSLTLSAALKTIKNSFARLQVDDGGSVDVKFKNLHHALRVGYQTNDILNTGNLNFPFKGERRLLLMAVKAGEVELPAVVECINEVIAEVKSNCEKAKANGLRSEVNKNLVDTFVYSQYYRAVQPDFWN